MPQPRATSALPAPLRAGGTWRALGAVIASVVMMALGGWAGSVGRSRPTSTLRDGFSVKGPRLLWQGRPFVLHGVQIVGLVAPTGALRGEYAVAHAHFGQGELLAAKRFGSNTIRFQVSQPGTDPRSPLYSASYVAEVARAVALARSDGFGVIVSLQDEPPSGETLRHRLPDAGTLRSWRTLAPLWPHDTGVMLELWNEPMVQATPAHWALWAHGGSLAPSREALGRRHTAFVGQTVVGMQQLVDVIRGTGSTNTLLLEGLTFASTSGVAGWTLQGMPAITDPLHQLAYAVHYPPTNRPPSVEAPLWRRDFGNEAGRAPVVVSEWWAGTYHWSCTTSTARTSTALVDYLARRGIGVVGFAFDLPGTIVSNYTWTPTSFARHSCRTASVFTDRRLPGPAAGPGRLLERLYRHPGTFATAGRGRITPPHLPLTS